MRILQATLNDIQDIMHIITLCVSKMNRDGSTQWDKNYPNEKVILTDIKNGFLYVLKDNHKIIGIITLNSCQNEEYKKITWSDPKGKVLVIHRMAVSVEAQGKGVAKNLMTFAEELAKISGYTSIRTDTYIENVKMQSIFNKLGYIKTGEVFFADKPKTFTCFEKVV